MMMNRRASVFGLGEGFNFWYGVVDVGFVRVGMFLDLFFRGVLAVVWGLIIFLIRHVRIAVCIVSLGGRLG
jgi:hypothetical protein